MLTDPDELAAPGFTEARRSMVPVKEFALDAVFAASLTVSRALAGARLAGPPAVELEPAPQPVTAAATMTAIPAVYNGQRAAPECTVTSGVRYWPLSRGCHRSVALRAPV
jgi:hypothetical protein